MVGSFDGFCAHTISDTNPFIISLIGSIACERTWQGPRFLTPFIRFLKQIIELAAFRMVYLGCLCGKRVYGGGKEVHDALENRVPVEILAPV